MEIKIESLKKVKLEEGEILIITFDPDEISEEELEASHVSCSKIFTKNKVMFVPKYMELSVMQNPDSIPIGG